MQGKILVAGSINIDIVVDTKSLPLIGETVKGKTIQYIPGGKGSNQAIAASRLGGRVSFIGKIGTDNFGDTLFDFLKNENIDLSGVTKSQEASGIAIITVDNNGQNTIVVVPGCNNEVTGEYIQTQEQLIKDTDIILSQYEIPLDSVEQIFTLGKKHGKKTILNPAPALKTSDTLFKNVDYLIVNETELCTFMDQVTDIHDIDKITTNARKLLARGPEVIIVTLGQRGAITVSKDSVIRTDGLRVKAVDTTAAGDCFVGALAVQLSKNKNLKESLEFANKAAAISVQQFGASSSIPYLKNL